MVFAPSQVELIARVQFTATAASLVGTLITLTSISKFRELSKRFFAFRLICALAIANGAASLLHLLGSLALWLTSHDTNSETICKVHELGLLYFNISSMSWTACFAFTMCRDTLPSFRRRAFRKYEAYFHALCWIAPFAIILVEYHLRDWKLAPSCCSVVLLYATQYLVSFYLPLVSTLLFVSCTYVLVIRRSAGRRISQQMSLFLLAFAIVWLPPLISRVQVLVWGAPNFEISLLVALCMPLQGLLNAVIYCWALPTIREMYRNTLLGVDSTDSNAVLKSESSPSDYSYSPPSIVSYSNIAAT